MTTSFTVAELGRHLSGLLSDAFPDDVWVSGEIRDLSRSAAGHVWFDLVDPDDEKGARLSVVLFDSNRRAVNAMLRRTGSIRMTDGVAVRVRAEVSFHTVRGRLQLRMVGIDPFHTLGALEAARDQLLRVLAAEGLLERNASRTVPVAPRVIGLVTSAGSAAQADFVHELENSGLGFHVALADARVQGDGAERSMVRAIRALERRRVDVIAVVRGGGARTDLAAFDTEGVARAIAGCDLPVFTGIGHETDTTVADAVASGAHKTPTACAASLVGLASAAAGRSEDLWQAVVERSRRRVDEAVGRLGETTTDLTSASAERLDDASRACGRLGSGLVRGGQQVLERSTHRLDLLSTRCEALDPRRTLERGWTLTRSSDGTLLRSADALGDGDLVTTLFRDGSVVSRVVDGDRVERTAEGQT